ncbi:hypothetical protein PM082_013626 [Marasmius tenuissimus]|nr:hypothetical protein PM082_013626 [Marasmius tenuissimus]
MLSAMDTVENLLKMKYTVSPRSMINPYHVQVVRTPLTQNINARLNDVHDEIVTAFNDHIPVKDDWIECYGHATVLKIVVRAANRLLVGLPLCKFGPSNFAFVNFMSLLLGREPDYCDLNLDFTINVIANSILIGLFPKILHPIVGRIFTARRSMLRRGMRHLGPIVRERLDLYHRYGKAYPDMPNDSIDWIIDVNAQVGEDWQKGSVEDIVLQILFINFTAIHTSSMAFTHALFHLTTNPQLVSSLREELEMAIERYGWCRSTIGKLRLMDSFLKESQRHFGAALAHSV